MRPRLGPAFGSTVLEVPSYQHEALGRRVVGESAPVGRVKVYPSDS